MPKFNEFKCQSPWTNMLQLLVPDFVWVGENGCNPVVRVASEPVPILACWAVDPANWMATVVPEHLNC